MTLEEFMGRGEKAQRAVDAARAIQAARQVGQPTFSLSLDGSALFCRVCGRASANPHDAANLYCGFCRVFHAREEGA